VTGARDPGTLRIATWNVEWFNALFDDAGTPLWDDEPSGRQGVSRAAQLDAIGIVLTALDADAVLIVEAPDRSARRDTVAALEAFAAACRLRARRGVMGFASETEQELALLFDPDQLDAVHDPRGDPTGRRGAGGAPRFDGTFRIDLDQDGRDETIVFARPPLELAVTLAGGRALRMIGVHAKSKAPHGARDVTEAMRIGIENRRKQLAQCLWLRARVVEHLASGDSLVVLGDLNDGPGLDVYEDLFGHSGVEVVLGLDAPPGLRLHDPHAAASPRRGGGPSTARFWIEAERRWLPALLDYVMLSPDLAARGPRWRIWHPFDDAAGRSVPELHAALLAASDHFPVSVDLPL
jgi:endonuclease/exonuclease/phosphatase family metal-dependent hydrolase